MISVLERMLHNTIHDQRLEFNKLSLSKDEK